jgi:hypothetical protein
VPLHVVQLSGKALTMGAHKLPRNATNFRLVWRGAVWPITLPVYGFKLGFLLELPD